MNVKNRGIDLEIKITRVNQVLFYVKFIIYLYANQGTGLNIILYKNF